MTKEDFNITIIISDIAGNQVYSNKYPKRVRCFQLKEDICKILTPKISINGIVILYGKQEIYDRIIIPTESESIIHLTIYFRTVEDAEFLDFLDKKIPQPKNNNELLNIKKDISSQINSANKSVVIAAVNKIIYSYESSIFLGLIFNYIDTSNERLLNDIDIILTVLSVDPLMIFCLKDRLEYNLTFFQDIMEAWINDNNLNSQYYRYTYIYYSNYSQEEHYIMNKIKIIKHIQNK